MDLEIQQKDAAAQMGINETTIANWLKQRAVLALRLWLQVIQFLGHDPRAASDDIGLALVRCRQGRGVSQKELTARLGVDPATLARWERGERQPTGRYHQRVEDLLNARLPADA